MKALSIEAESFRLQSERHHDPEKPCACCKGEPHIFACGFRPVDAPMRWYKPDEMMDLHEWLHSVEYSFRLRPGTRVRITVEEIDPAPALSEEGR